MADTSRTFEGVSPEIWKFLKEDSEHKHGTVYDPPDGDSGTATTSTIIGTLELTYNFDREQNKVTFTIESKPVLVPAGRIWDGIQNAIDSQAGK